MQVVEVLDPPQICRPFLLCSPSEYPVPKTVVHPSACPSILPVSSEQCFHVCARKNQRTSLRFAPYSQQLLKQHTAARGWPLVARGSKQFLRPDLLCLRAIQAEVPVSTEAPSQKLRSYTDQDL